MPDPVSVSDAVGLAKITVNSIPRLAVVGEVTGFRGPNARSGHCYFQVKDESSTMDVIIWRNVFSSLDFQLKDGLEIVLYGSFDVYEATARMSFIATRVEVSGEGALRQKVAALANKLKAEGLMDPSRKKPVPRFCTRVGVVTSLSGSVIDDVKRTLARRNPLVELYVFGCSVQGAGAEATIIRALQAAQAQDLDCILLVRGGGSYEDLMTFNDEALARAIAASSTPIVTGIGHEPDTSIADMVADRRQSTPTAAAESVAPALDEIVAQIDERRARLVRVMSTTLLTAQSKLDSLQAQTHRAMQTRLTQERLSLEALAKHRCLSKPTFMIDDLRTQLVLGEERFYDALPRSLARYEEATERLALSLANGGKRLLSPHVLAAERLSRSMESAGRRLTDAYRSKTERLEASLAALSPLSVLSRGYAIVSDAAGHVVSSAQAVSAGDGIQVRLADGTFEAQVTKDAKDTAQDAAQDKPA